MAKNGKPDGFYVPIHQSLIRPLLMAGIPRDVCILNMTIAFSFFMQHVYPFLLINVVIHLVAKALTKKDEQFFDALKRHINDKKYYGV